MSSTFYMYCQQRIDDINTLKNYLPEMAPIIDVSIEGTRKVAKHEYYGEAMRYSLSQVIGRELSFEAADVMSQIITSHVLQTIITSDTEIDSLISNRPHLSCLTNSLLCLTSR